MEWSLGSVQDQLGRMSITSVGTRWHSIHPEALKDTKGRLALDRRCTRNSVGSWMPLCTRGGDHSRRHNAYSALSATVLLVRTMGLQMAPGLLKKCPLKADRLWAHDLLI